MTVYDPTDIQLRAIADLMERLNAWQDNESLRPGDHHYGEGFWADIDYIPVRTDAKELLGWIVWRDSWYVFTQTNPHEKEN